MSVTERLVRLYPAAVRDRWGEGLADDARAAGWRGWPNLLRGVADMWLHPVVWPADSRAQRLRRAATLGVAVALFTLLLGHAAAEQGVPLGSAPGGALLVPVSSALVLLGVLLAAPRPRLSLAAAVTVVWRGARLLAAPVLLAAAVVVLAHVHTGPAGPGEHLAADCWWLSLAAGAVQACRVVAGLGGATVVAPTPWQLHLGLWSLTAGSLLTGSAALSAALGRPEPDRAAVVAGSALVLLALTLTATLRDLHES
jgi:hypothetical protein